MMKRRLLTSAFCLITASAAGAAASTAWVETFRISPATYTMTFAATKDVPPQLQAALRPTQST